LHRPNAHEIPVSDAWDSARQWVPRLRREADFVVVLSHLGLAGDLRLAAETPGIDLIVGGHSHHRLPTPLRVGNTSIAQAGVNGAYLGVITVTREGDEPRITGRLEPVWQELAPEAGSEARVRRYLERYWPEALEVVGSTSGCWGDPWQENAWANWVTDTFRQWARTEVCFCKAMTLFPALDRGPMTRWDLLRCLPTSACDRAMGLDALVTMRLSGAAIRAVCEHSVSDLPRDLHPPAPPDAGVPENNLLHASGLRLACDLSRPAGERVTCLSVAGQPVKPDRLYSVVTSGFLARGYSGFHWFRDGEARQVGDRGLEILLRQLRPGVTLPAVDGRLQFHTGLPADPGTA
jgi:2',3'-cyclic-nucleotide 2'-phosphodiesterase (5'-nucleotidase family)